METIRISFASRVRSALLLVLTLTMLVLAILYIGGSRRADGAAALQATPLPDGTVTVGEDLPSTTPLYEKDLLPLSFAAIRYGNRGGGAYVTDAAAYTLFDYAAKPIHHSLSGAFLLSAVPRSEFGLALFGDYLYLDFQKALPYQMYYAFTGEYTAAARSSVAVNADRLLLSFTKDGTVTLYLSDGKNYYRAGQNYSFKATEVAALAADSRLSAFALTELGVPHCAAAPRTATLSLASDGGITEAQYAALLPLLGFSAAGADDPTSQTLVDPHGTLRMTPSRFVFSASRDGGIAISDLLDTAKEALDIGPYDVLSASVSMLEHLQKTLPQAAGAGLSPCLVSFTHSEDVYTVVFGASADGILLSGTLFPFLAKMTVQNGRFRSVELRYIHAEKDSYTRTQFSSTWSFAHARKSGELSSLRLGYRLPTLPAEGVDAAWYCTYESEVAK